MLFQLLNWAWKKVNVIIQSKLIRVDSVTSTCTLKWENGPVIPCVSNIWAPLHKTTCIMVTLQLMISLQSMVTIIDFLTLISYGAVLLW